MQEARPGVEDGCGSFINGRVDVTVIFISGIISVLVFGISGRGLGCFLWLLPTTTTKCLPKLKSK